MKMDMKKVVSLIGSHIAIGVVGFVLGIYTLPILIAPKAMTHSEVDALNDSERYSTEFIRDIEGSDFLHWGEGVVSVGDRYITFKGELAPGPDYRLYLSPEFITSENQFISIKDSMVMVGKVDSFENFAIPISSDIDISRFNTVVIWCERFRQFITAAQYREYD